MKERPILFSAPMVKAILAGTKTQTRRLIKSPSRRHPRYALVDYGNGWWPYLSDDGESHVTEDGNETEIDCPFGSPGDRLWVRETWAWSGDKSVPEHTRIEAGEVWYRADPRRDNPAIRWRPSIHMPRWASRITLEVISVRVERVQDISDEAAIAEGLYAKIRRDPDVPFPLATNAITGSEQVLMPGAPRMHYADLWRMLHGPGAWDDNPWVWVISFRRPGGTAQEKAG